MNSMQISRIPPGEFLPGDRFVDFSCEDPALFDFATNEDLWEKADALTAAFGVLPVGQFKKLERSAG